MASANSVHELIAANASLNPDGIAVSDGNRNTLTYAQLVSSARRLGAKLQGLGVGPEKTVAVVVERSFSMFVGMLGALFAGGSYVAIDNTYPTARIEFMLSDTDSKVILTTADLKSAIPASFTGTVVVLDEAEAASWPAAEALQPTPDLKPENLCAMFYTSGTTGNPKGVMLEHRNTIAFLTNHAWDAMLPTDVVAQLTSPCFIGSMNDVWLPLAKGACANVVPREIMLSPSAFETYASTHKLTAAFFTPKMLEMYADTRPEALAHLRLVQFAGEKARADAILKLANALPGLQLQHLYGCTEHNSLITSFIVPSGAAGKAAVAAAGGDRLPIGQPTTNVKCYVLSAELEPVDVMVTGELFVTSPQLSRGYRNRPEANTEKFITHPKTGERLYRTGDQARWLPRDLGLDLIGRIGTDTMVKIAGYRVELGAVESAGMAAAGPLGAVGCVATLNGEDLVLYVAPETVNVEELRELLEARLAHYEVPAYIVPIPSIPLTTNGKLDVKALPPPTRHQRGVSRLLSRGASSELGAAVRTAFEKILGLPKGQVGMNHTFWQLNGTSLKAMPLLAHLARELGPSLTFQDLTEAPTPRLLAQRISALLRAEMLAEFDDEGAATVVHKVPKELIAISRGSMGEDGSPPPPPVFAIHGGTGRALFGLAMAQYMSKRALYCVEWSPAAVELATSTHPEPGFIVGLAQHYVKCIRQVQPKGPYTICGGSLGSVIGFEMIRQLEAVGEVVERFYALDLPVRWRTFLGARKQVAATASCREEKPEMVLLGGLATPAISGKGPEELEQVMQKIEEDFDRRAAAYEDQHPLLVSGMIMLMGEAGAGQFMEGQRALGPCFMKDPITDNGPVKAPITVVRAGENKVMRHRLRTIGLLEEDGEDYGWRDFTTSGIEVTSVPGNHVTMTVDPDGCKAMAELFQRGL